MYGKVVSTFLCIIFCSSMQVSAKVRGEANIIAIDSEVLNETRELMVHLPNNYERYTDTSYPVLYLLDGQRNFAHAAGTLDLLNQSGMASEMIIVAINNTHRTRDFTPTYDESYNERGISGGADNFLTFLGSELKPYIKSHYRTNGYAILSGHSLGGLLSLCPAIQTRTVSGLFCLQPQLVVA